MRLALVLVVLLARDARAVSVCRGEHGWAPAAGTTLPPHARLLWFTDGHGKDITTPNVSAKLDGKPIKTKVTKAARTLPYVAFVVEIDSDATGALDVELADIRAHYDVRNDARRPTAIHATWERYDADIRYTEIPETYDGVALVLDEPAVIAHLKLRHDAKADWQTFDVPVMREPEPLQQLEGDRRPEFVPIGKLGCTQNYSTDLLAAGVDLEVTVTFADGRTVPVEGLPAHLKSP